jgi:hypothetical protein
MIRALGYAIAAWCLGFAGVSAWQVATDLIGRPVVPHRYAAYASGLAIMGVLVAVLKLAGAAVALAAVVVRPDLPRRPGQLLGMALWGAFGLLARIRRGTAYHGGDGQWPTGPVGGLDRRRWRDRKGDSLCAVLPHGCGNVRGSGGLVPSTPPPAVDVGSRRAGRSAAAAWADPGRGPRGPGPVGLAAHLTELRVGPTSRLLAPRQATFARLMILPRRWSRAWRLRQAR